MESNDPVSGVKNGEYVVSVSALNTYVVGGSGNADSGAWEFVSIPVANLGTLNLASIKIFFSINLATANSANTISIADVYYNP